MKKNIAFTWGATGGHVFPIVSLYNYLKDNEADSGKKYNFFWFGEEDGLEEDIATKYKIPFFDIPCGKVRRYFDIRNFYEPLKNLTGIFFGIHYLLKHKIDLVFSKGGYVSLPLCIAAWILRRDIYIHESDTTGWMANKLIAKVATKVFYSFPNDRTRANELKENGPQKHIHVGQILNPELLDYIESVDVIENENLEIMVIAGSQGSTTIFEALLDILPQLDHIKFHVVLWEKNKHFRDAFKKFPNVLAHDFITQKRLWKILKNVDIAITRAGATTLWELNVFGIHSIIIPLSSSAGNHQQSNGEYFHKEFGSDVLDENMELQTQILWKLQAYQDLRKQGLNLKGFFKPLKKISKHF